MHKVQVCFHHATAQDGSTGGKEMIVRKVRGQDKVGKIILSYSEVLLAEKLGMTVERYASRHLELIAKKRRWKWFFERKNK
jgi:hypothetical protein